MQKHFFFFRSRQTHFNNQSRKDGNFFLKQTDFHTKNIIPWKNAYEKMLPQYFLKISLIFIYSTLSHLN